MSGARTCISGEVGCGWGPKHTMVCGCCGKTVCWCQTGDGEEGDARCPCHDAAPQKQCNACWERWHMHPAMRAEIDGQQRLPFDTQEASP